ncbi:hypothetical protein [Caproiciproducens sp.]
MISGTEIKEFRNLRGVSLRDVAKALKDTDKSLSAQFIGQIENEQKSMNEDNYKKIILGINLAFAKKTLGNKTEDNEDSGVNEDGE